MGSTTMDDVLDTLAEAEALAETLADHIRLLCAEREALTATVQRLEARLQHGASAYEELAARYEALAHSQSSVADAPPLSRSNTAKSK